MSITEQNKYNIIITKLYIYTSYNINNNSNKKQEKKTKATGKKKF